ncbi:MAG: nucleoid-associated protein [Lutibacter sp.]
MIKRNKAQISKFIIHKVGNKYNEAVNVLSESELTFDVESYELMLPFLLKPFTNLTQSYRFTHHATVELNEINNYVSQIFNNPDSFVEISKHIVNHLYEQSNSAQIKTGDVLVALFEDIEFNEMNTKAVGVFKIENKSEFFQTYTENNSIDVVVQKGISTKKLDKGCLILESSDAEGKIVLSVDTNNYDAQYWLQHFLNVKYADDSNQHTQNYLEMCSEFSNDVLKEDFGTPEKNKFLAKTVDYFKENETINIHDFKDEIFEDQEEQKALFDDYKKQFESLNSLLVRNQFPVAEKVLKKQKQKLKTEIRLDTHIQIKLDVDALDANLEYIEQGFDETKKMKYYKVFYNEEQP